MLIFFVNGESDQILLGAEFQRKISFVSASAVEF